MKEFKAQSFVVCYILILYIGFLGCDYISKALINIIDYDTSIGKTIYFLIMSLITAIFYFGGTFLCSLLLTPIINLYVYLIYVVIVDLFLGLIIRPYSDIGSLVLYMIFIASTVTPVILRINAVNKKPPTQTT